MKYQLTSGWQLRGWETDVWMLYDRQHAQKPRRLSRKAFLFLRQCDGQTELPEDDAARHYLALGIIAPADLNGGAGDAWRYRYHPHRYVNYVQWSITGRCNYRCRHCFAATDLNPSTTEYTLEQCMGIVQQFADCGVEEVSLTGGEPLLHPHFLKIVQALVSRGIQVKEILTNGALLTPQLLEQLRGMGTLPIIGMSFDGLGTHSWMRGVDGAEEAAVRAFRAGAAAGFPMKGTININPHTLPRLAETCRFLKDLGCGTLHIIRTGEVPRWVRNGGQSLSFAAYYEALADLTDVYLRESWELELRLFNCMVLPADGTLPDLLVHWDDPIREDCLFRCKKAKCGFFLTADGRVLPCDVFEGVSTAFGQFQTDNNILTRSLEDILTDSELSRAMAITVEAFCRARPACAACRWLPLCHGGCRIGAYGWSGSLLGASPLHCTMFRGGYASQLRELILAHRAGEHDATTLDADTGLSLLRTRQKAACCIAAAEAEVRALCGQVQVPYQAEKG